MADNEKNENETVSDETTEEGAAKDAELTDTDATETKSSEDVAKDVEDEVASVGAEQDEAAADPQEVAAKNPPEAKSGKKSKKSKKQKKKSARDAFTPDSEAEAEAAADLNEPSQVEKDKARATAEGMETQPEVSREDAAHLVNGDDPAIERRPALYLAQYETPDELHAAACQVRDAGFEQWDCHTPYPVHGLDEAMGLPPTKIGLISFGHALIGLATAVLMIQFMNNWDYPIVVGGKPPGAFPSMVPIMFELTVLLTGFGTLFGLLHLARLPRHHHPIFESDRFAKATDDKFFISIEVQDAKFDLETTRDLLEGTGPSHIELVEEELV